MHQSSVLKIFISRGKVNNPVYIGHLPAGLAGFCFGNQDLFVKW